jgi:hypothetical protein
LHAFPQSFEIFFLCSHIVGNGDERGMKAVEDSSVVSLRAFSSSLWNAFPNRQQFSLWSMLWAGDEREMEVVGNFSVVSADGEVSAVKLRKAQLLLTLTYDD